MNCTVDDLLHAQRFLDRADAAGPPRPRVNPTLGVCSSSVCWPHTAPSNPLGHWPNHQLHWIAAPQALMICHSPDPCTDVPNKAISPSAAFNSLWAGHQHGIVNCPPSTSAPWHWSSTQRLMWVDEETLSTDTPRILSVIEQRPRHQPDDESPCWPDV